MTLTDAMNAGAHGHIHELLGGTWAAEWTGMANRTNEIIFPFLHSVVVSQSTLVSCLATNNILCLITSLNNPGVSNRRPIHNTITFV